MADKPPSTIYVRGIKTPVNLDEIFRKDQKLDFVLISTQNPSNMAILSTKLLGAGKNKPTNLLLSQTTPPLPPGIKNATIYISTLINVGGLERIGAKCTIIHAYKTLPWNNRKIAALQIEYTLPFVKLNVRASYRAKPREGFDIDGIISWNNDTFVSRELKGKKPSFSIENVSTAGIALKFPMKLNDDVNPLAHITKGSRLQMALKLQSGPGKPVKLVKTGVLVVRVEKKEEEGGVACFFLGGRFFSMKKELKNSLFIFVNKIMVADMHETKAREEKEKKVVVKHKIRPIKPLNDYIFFGGSKTTQSLSEDED